MIFVAEFVAAVDSGGTLETILVGSEGFMTGAADTPASTPVRARLVNPGEFSRSIASGKLLIGQVSAGFGTCVIANGDGALDAWCAYGVGDRAFTLRACDEHPGTYPAGWTTIYVATMDSIVPSGQNLHIKLAEKIRRLEKPMCGTFAGTGGIEGPADYDGEPKPVCYGAVYNAPLTLLDSAELIYMASSRGSVVANHAKDKGSVIARALTSGDDGDATTIDPDAYADYAALEAANVPIGHYVTIASAGVAKFGSPPVGQLTADLMELTGPDTDVAFGAGDRWTEGDTGTANTDAACAYWNVIQSMALDAGLDPSEISTDDWTFFDAHYDDSFQFGFYARDLSTTYAQGMSLVAASAAAWVGFDRLGVLRLQEMYEPDHTFPFTTDRDDVAWEFDEHSIALDSLSLVQSEEPGRGVPFRRIVMRYPRNWTPQTDLAGAVTDEVRAQVSQDWPKTVTRASTTIDDQYKNAGDFDLDVYTYGWRASTAGDLQTNSGGATLTKLRDMLCTYRQWVEFDAPFALDMLAAVDIGSLVQVTHPRFGLDAGKVFRVVGIRYSFTGAPKVRLTVWG